MNFYCHITNGKHFFLKVAYFILSFRALPLIPTAVISVISKKISKESCKFKSYKEIVTWLEDNYQLSVKYQTLHKQVHYRMKAKLKVPRRCSNKKDASAYIEFKNN
jgi:putative transposase